jgi:tRNA uridine 5-carboxymethylaminomethyl modification enzyme
MSLQNIANVLQSCHGRNCKGQIVREIDALGGYSGIVSDRTAIQFKMLNKSKGQQCGRQEFSAYAVCGRMAINVGRNSKPRFYQEMVNSLIIEKGK